MQKIGEFPTRPSSCPGTRGRRRPATTRSRLSRATWRATGRSRPAEGVHAKSLRGRARRRRGGHPADPSRRSAPTTSRVGGHDLSRGAQAAGRRRGSHRRRVAAMDGGASTRGSHEASPVSPRDDAFSSTAEVVQRFPADLCSTDSGAKRRVDGARRRNCATAGAVARARLRPARAMEVSPTRGVSIAMDEIRRLSSASASSVRIPSHAGNALRSSRRPDTLTNVMAVYRTTFPIDASSEVVWGVLSILSATASGIRRCRRLPGTCGSGAQCR